MEKSRVTTVTASEEFLSRIVKTEIHFSKTATMIAQVDATVIEGIRDEAAISKPSYTAFVIKALASALIEYPYANRRFLPSIVPFFGRQRSQTFSSADIAVAAEREVPECHSVSFVDVLRSAETKSLQEIGAWLRNLREASEENNEQWRAFRRFMQMRPSWLWATYASSPRWSPRLWEKHRGGAALISVPTKYGVDTLVTAWTAPIGISFGLVKPRPIVRNGQVVPALAFDLILNFDRTVMGGAKAGRFFAGIVDNLQNRERLLS